jgi:hypothetical protein
VDIRVGASGLEIVPVNTAHDLDRFIKLPWRLQAGDPVWIPPLLHERKGALSPEKNPFFRHAEVMFWVARRYGRDVGRISAQIDRLALAARPGIGSFGLIAAEDDEAVFSALTGTAETWLRERGMTKVQGPFSLSINEEAGLLVDGFETPPMLLMPHDPPYTGARLEQQGYTKAKDLIAYLYDIRADLPLAARALIERPLPAGVELRRLDASRYRAEIAALTEIFNDAWSGNWGFVPLTEEDTGHLAEAMRPLIRDDLVWFVEVKGEPAAFGVCLPNLNEAIRDLGGRLLPIGWLKLLWRLKVAGLRTARVPLMGVKRKFANGLLGSLMPFLIVDALRRNALRLGFRQVELSWILDDNLPMRRINEALGGRPYKTYRVYEKALPWPA